MFNETKEVNSILSFDDFILKDLTKGAYITTKEPNANNEELKKVYTNLNNFYYAVKNQWVNEADNWKTDLENDLKYLNDNVNNLNKVINDLDVISKETLEKLKTTYDNHLKAFDSKYSTFTKINEVYKINDELIKNFTKELDDYVSLIKGERDYLNDISSNIKSDFSDMQSYSDSNGYIREYRFELPTIKEDDKVEDKINELRRIATVLRGDIRAANKTLTTNNLNKYQFDKKRIGEAVNSFQNFVILHESGIDNRIKYIENLKQKFYDNVKNNLTSLSKDTKSITTHMESAKNLMQSYPKKFKPFGDKIERNKLKDRIQESDTQIKSLNEQLKTNQSKIDEFEKKHPSIDFNKLKEEATLKSTQAKENLKSKTESAIKIHNEKYDKDLEENKLKINNKKEILKNATGKTDNLESTIKNLENMPEKLKNECEQKISKLKEGLETELKLVEDNFNKEISEIEKNSKIALDQKTELTNLQKTLKDSLEKYTIDNKKDKEELEKLEPKTGLFPFLRL